MQNIVGQVPRGSNFYPRDNVINKIYRRLGSGSHVYIAAPRRVGKTAIMQHLADNPRAGYCFQYLTVESVETLGVYFKRLLESLRTMQGLADKSLSRLNTLWQRLEKIELAGVKLELRSGDSKGVAFFSELKQQLQNLETLDGQRLVLMLDEFPQTVENLRREHGNGEAEQFLQLNRELRQQCGKVQFIYTGSIGLQSIAEKLDASKEINDINIVEVPPLQDNEATDLLQRLFLHEKVICSPATTEHLLDKLAWLVPFHVQLAAQGLIDRYHDKELKGLRKADVDTVFADITNTRHSQYFEHYYSRLKKTLDEAELAFALPLLLHLAQAHSMPVWKPGMIILPRQQKPPRGLFMMKKPMKNGQTTLPVTSCYCSPNNNTR
ncbi:ATP-binding protein [Candidatus Venteria ishoeyi]|uniref:ATP-binding protein n=1 Tax=Candidatus Venteria ishoeyi TaxID=1899563 RepID=UPI0025A61C8D|nr:ATP-binding protein [Candidatus Venteria ishoeyi]MDM8547039.1 ATP-binding protein [Candidatus Venteria ishoeyi]